MSNNFKDNSGKFKRLLTKKEETALREVGKFLRKRIKAKVRRRTGNLKKALGYRIRKKDKEVRIGYRLKGFYGGFFEKGTKNIQKEAVILPTIEENSSEIKAIIARELRGVGH